MNLDLVFIFYGTIIILGLLPLYIYRKKIYLKFIKTGNVEVFVNELESYLKSNHPKIRFDFSRSLKKIKNEKDIRLKESLIIEDLVSQFSYYEYELKTQESISKDNLWSSYINNLKPTKANKLPSDWNQRKEASWIRDKNQCNRCGTKIKLVDAQALLVKQTENGGGFNVENIVILCSDCARLVKSSNIEKTSKDLVILDKLMKYVSN